MASSAQASDYGFSGSLIVTSVLPPASSGSVYVQASYSVGHSCSSLPGDYTYCGYFLTVSTVPLGTPCRPDTLEWVQNGIYDGNQGQVPQSGQAYWTEYATAAAQPMTACLYTGSDDRLITSTNYTIPGTAPLPATPAPTPNAYASGDAPFLGNSEAVQATRSILGRKLGNRWKSGRSRHVSCTRVSSIRMSCHATWKYGIYRYAVGLTIRETTDNYEYQFGHTVKRRI
jgi:hypothetical protein